MEKTHSDTLLGRTIHTNLFIRSKLGDGGMGEVYLAENTVMSEMKYAVKVLRRELTTKPAFRERFYEEARQQAQLDHPNIVHMHDYFQLGDDYFLVLAYVNGQTLGQMINSGRGPLKEELVLKIICEVLAALNCAHEHGILHRDVKPSNVLVDKSGLARLTDFGIARPLGSTARSEAGMTIGTIEYMSPEQIRDPDTVDQRADVYSAGILLFEMLTGRVPFTGTPEAIREAQLGTPPPDPRAFNPAIKNKLADIVNRAIRKDPDTRFQGCLEFKEAIEEYRRPGVWRWVVLMLVLPAAGVGAYHVFVTQPETMEVVRGHAQAAIGNYALLCQQVPALRLRRDWLRVAQESGNTDLEPGLERQVREVRANMRNFADIYTRQIEAMHGYDPGIVRRALAEGPEGADVAHRRYFWQLATRDYGSLAAGGAPPRVQAMLDDCPR